MFLFFDSLYKETFPPVTGVSRTIHALEIPLHEDESCQYPISFSGDEKFKLFVIATGSAPTQLTFLADSATAAIDPLKGSSATHLLLQSTEAATPENTFCSWISGKSFSFHSHFFKRSSGGLLTSLWKLTGVSSDNAEVGIWATILPLW